jgi:ADYC domain
MIPAKMHPAPLAQPMDRRPTMRTVCLLSLALVGCADVSSHEEAPDESVHEAMVGGDYWDDDIQGLHLLGNEADKLLGDSGHYSVNTSATLSGKTVTLTMQGEQLTATGSAGTFQGMGLKGLVMKGSDSSTLTILTVDTSKPTRAAFELVRTVGATNSAYCDATLGRYAYAMVGKWSKARSHTLTTDISFACARSGVAAKCIDWDFKPGTVGPTDLLWEHHQACTQMANANYCMDGEAHTYDQTPVRIRDWNTTIGKPAPDEYPLGKPDLRLEKAPPTLPGDPDRIYFEAAWAPNTPVLCLSSLRWLSMPTDGPCGQNSIPDPRIEGSGAKFCEDWTTTDFINAHALVVNGSRTMDMRIFQWARGTTTAVDRLATVRGYYVEDAPRRVAPFGIYNATDGVSDGLLLRNLPGSIPASTVNRLYVQYSVSGRVIAGETLLPGHNWGPTGTPVYEGSVFKVSGAGREAFYVYDNGTDYVSGTSEPPNGGPWTRGARLGYVISDPE